MTERLQRRPMNAERTRTIHMPRPDAAAWAALWGRRPAPRTLLPGDDKTERRMVLLQWLIMPLVLAGLLIFGALLPLHVAPPTLASEIIGLYALTYVIGLLSQAEKAVSVAAIENARLAQAVLQRNRELGALNRLARALNAETDPSTILQLGLDGVVEALELDTARAYQHEEGELRLAAQVGGVHAEPETEA